MSKNQSVKPEEVQEVQEPVQEAKARKVKGENGREYEIPANLPKGTITVRQVSIELLNGGMVEVPNTEMIQHYSKEVFDRLVENEFFSESKIKVEVLHK